jgi:hypothetical protein
MTDDRVAFVRHTDQIPVPGQLLWDLWNKQNRIAIHWANRIPPDAVTLDEAAHDTPEAKQAVDVFRHLNEKGGLVISRSHVDRDSIKVGRIRPGSFRPVPTTWRPTAKAKEKDYKRMEGSPTVLKTLEFDVVHRVDEDTVQDLVAAWPAQVACSWSKKIQAEDVLRHFPDLA